MNHDVVVVGAGPAGSSTAKGIAKAGFKAVIIEKKRTVGHPVFCSGLVTPRVLEVAGVTDGLIQNEIKGATIYSTAGRQLDVGGDRVYALAIDRAGLDKVLVQQAMEAGAELLVDTKVVKIEREDRCLKILIDRNGKVDQLVTKLLVGADGVGSLVAKTVGPRHSDGTVKAIAGEGWLSCSESQRAGVFVGGTVAPGWFGWLIPLGDGRVRIGTGNGNHSSVPPRQLFNEMLAAFPERFKGIRIERLWNKTIPLYSPSRSFADNILLVGDAARQVKPTSGGGIYTGLVAASHCATVAIAALSREDYSESFLSRYETAWMGDIGEELKRGLALRKVFLELSDLEKDKLLDVLRTSFLQKLLSRFGDIDYPSRAVARLGTAPAVLAAVRNMSVHFPLRWFGEPRLRSGSNDPEYH